MWNGKEVAVKELKVNLKDDDEANGTISETELSKSFAEFRREIWWMNSMSHPAIAELHALVMKPLCIVTEFVPGGSLFDYIHEDKKEVTWPLRVKIALDISSALQHMHSFNPPIMHRDLKSPNILLTKKVDAWEQQPVVAKVTDFGLTGLVHSMTGREVDNPVWLAPEVMSNKDYDEKADVYSFAVILYELLTKQEFLGDISRFMSDKEQMIIEGKRPELDPNDQEINMVPEYVELMKSCWAQDPEARPTFVQCTAQLVEIRNKYFPHVAIPPPSRHTTLLNQEINVPKLNLPV